MRLRILFALLLAMLTLGGPAMASYNGTGTGTPTYTIVSGFGSALTLNGTSQYVTIPVAAVAPCEVSGGSWTIEERINTSSSGFQVSETAFGGPSTFYCGTNASKATFSAGNTVNGATNICDGKPHVVAYECLGGTMLAIYVDGKLDAYGATTWAGGAGTSVAQIGTFNGSLYWSGQIDDVAISTGALYQMATYTVGASPLANGRVNQVALYHFDGDLTDANTGVAGSYSTVAVTDSHIYWSKSNWTSGSGYKLSDGCSGEYLYASMGGTSLALNVDVSRLVAASVPAADYPYVRYEVDNSVWRDAQESPITQQIPIASGLSAGTHLIQFYGRGMPTEADRWTTNVVGLKVTGLQIDSTDALQTYPVILPKLLYSYGDSITEGANIFGLATSIGGAAATDATESYVPLLAKALGAEYAQFGYSGQGWTLLNGTSTNVPPLFTPGNDTQSSWNKHYAGTSRLVGGLFSPQPDYITIMLGTNDVGGGATTSAVSASAAGTLAAFRGSAPNAKIFGILPFGSFDLAAVTTGFNNYQTSTPDPNTYLINLGLDAYTQAALSGYGVSYLAPLDGIHPGGYGQARMAALIAQAIQAKLAPASQSGQLRRGR